VKKTPHLATPTLNVGDYVEYCDNLSEHSTVHGEVTGFYGLDRVKVLTQTGNVWLLKRLSLNIVRRRIDSIKIG
jgi:hypothetical protein